MSYKEFPMDIFPSNLQLSIKKMAESYAVNVDPIAVAMLTILSVAIGNTTRVSPKKGWQEPMFLWSVVIGPSGSGKTPFVTKLLEYLYDRQSETYEVYKNKMEEYEASDLDGAKPQLVRHIVSDITIESLALAMESQPRGIMSYQDELSGWILSHDQYRAKGGDRQKYLELWNCNPWLKDRVSSGSQFIRNTGCAILGGIQPLVLPKVFREDSLIDGLLPRFLFTSLSDQPYSNLPLLDEDMYVWKSLIHGCYQIPLEKDGDNTRYRVISFSPEAQIMFAKFNNEFRECKQPLLQVFIPKLIGYAIRLSGILYVIRNTKDKEINIDVLNDSIRLIDYFWGQVKGTLALYGKGGSQYTEQDERLISVLELLGEEVNDGLLSIEEITQEFNKDLQEELCLDNQKIAFRLIDLGLRTRKSGGYSYLVWEQLKIEKLVSTC